MKVVRIVLLGLLLALLLGLVVGTLIRLRLEKPARYIGQSEAVECTRRASAIVAIPRHVRHARALILEPRQHEEEIG